MKIPSMKKKCKIVFIIGALSQPRCIKRVVSFAEAGYECVVYGYNRGCYDVNTFPCGIEVNVLGTLNNGDSISNLIEMRKNLGGIIKANGRDCIYYSFGFLSSFLLSLKTKIDYIYEISDILYAYPKYDKFSWILKKIDRRIIRKAKLIVMTSGGFKEYIGVYDDKIIIQPNKISSIFSKYRRNKYTFNAQKLKFAFIGAIRYESIFRFAQVIGEHFQQHEFHFYGGASDSVIKQVIDLCERYCNIKYHGVFKSPDDLPKIYNEIDIVVACYDINSLNERIAEPNKLYESIFFCKPIIVSAQTYLANRVKKLGCGFVLEKQDKDEMIDFINKLNEGILDDISKRELMINNNEVVDDVSELISHIEKMQERLYSNK